MYTVHWANMASNNGHISNYRVNKATQNCHKSDYKCTPKVPEAIYTVLWARKGGQLADAIRTSQELVGIISELVGTGHMHFAA